MSSQSRLWRTKWGVIQRLPLFFSTGFPQLTNLIFQNLYHQFRVMFNLRVRPCSQTYLVLESWLPSFCTVYCIKKSKHHYIIAFSRLKTMYIFQSSYHDIYFTEIHVMAWPGRCQEQQLRQFLPDHFPKNRALVPIWIILPQPSVKRNHTRFV